MRLSDDTKRAMRATSQWKLGTQAWAEMFIRIAEADDPILAAEFYLQASAATTVDAVIPDVDPLTNMDV